ncbi:MAG: N-6 DNA methylase [Anaerolineales bacterium]|nr:N-6 DNA methylase [Anaerolineales bacterium]
MTSQTAPASIHKLVETFEQNLDSYRSSKNETELRREFLDKFFAALGWDVANEKAYDEAHKEVVHEFSVEVSGQQKKADYAFRVGSAFDFLVEAKKPSVKIESSQDAAFQIRRYGWSAKLPINILTDFEHFAVYDCRAKPSYNDKAATGRILLIHYTEYVERWDEIAAIFSPEAVRQGSFAKYAEGMKGKRGTADVDDAFLQEIERWRELLAKNIALRNEDIDIAGLNYAVQMTIDRIVFLRICEERGIEAENQLLDLVTLSEAKGLRDHRKDSSVAALPQNDMGRGVYQELCELFKRADTKYNSGLFHFKQEKEQASRADDLTLDLAIDDKVLKDIISNLYYPKSPYAFLYIPADILGQVYERFLGKVIRLTAGHQAKVEEKPEVRKAGGVYYTPTYIVDYIVKNTVGRIINSTYTPKEVAKLKIVDPACGSGTFLLGAYQFLLDWHLNWYVNDDVEKWVKQKAILKAESGYRLTTSKKKEILLNNIHGVDIDAQAVEVTKLSLLLKVLENASGQMGLGMERVLPDLGNNIKCGNSLIGWDYFEGQLLPDDEERARVNPFDWKSEFPQVFQQTSEVSKTSEVSRRGGFDAVIGNPPWGGDLTFEEKDYLIEKFASVHMRTPDTFNYLMANAHNLTSRSGIVGFIIPNNFLFQHEYAKAREFYTRNAKLLEAINLGDDVFAVTAPSCIVIVERNLTSNNNYEVFVSDLRNVDRSNLPEHLVSRSGTTITPTDILESPDFVIPMNKIASRLISKIIKVVPTLLGDVCDEVAAGIGTGGDKIFRISDTDAKKHRIEENLLHPVLVGRDIQAYYLPENSGYSIIYSTKAITSKTHPKTLEYLKPFQDKLSQKREAQKGLIPWWSLHWPRYPELFNAPKIILRQTANSLYATLDNIGYYCINSIIIIRPKNIELILFYLGLLNSRLVRWVYQNLTQEENRVFAEVKPVNLRKLPIRTIDFTNPAEKAQHDKMVALVEAMLAAHKSLAAAHSPAEKERLERQIQVTDKEIDSLVYQLYGLNEEEIKIVES